MVGIFKDMDLKEKLEKTKQLNDQIKICQRCQLYKGTINAVPGEGNLDAKLMFIGEGPGFHEDKEGRPFVGQAGKLLDKLIQSLGLKREEVFIANVVKHRPPENRDPLPNEIDACAFWLDQQIDLIDPKIIVTLGRFSMAKFIPNVTISNVHGQQRFITWKGKRKIIIPMYHPAAALRAGAVMEQLEKDFQKIPQFLKDPEPLFPKAEEKKEEDQLKLI